MAVTTRTTTEAPIEGSAIRDSGRADTDASARGARVSQPASISVVIPVYDEAGRIAEQLQHLRQTPGLHEVVVVDGGSRDDTRQRAEAVDGVRVISAPRGRAAQMNAGAEVATGEVLLFLHADVRLPHDVSRRVRQTLSDPATIAGAFLTHTVDEGRRRWLAPLLRLADVRSRYTRFPYGDQALFVRARYFWRAGAYPSQPLMEDVELCRRLRREGRIERVPACVRVSGRRFTARPLYYTVAVNLIPLAYWCGVSPERLARFYRPCR